MFKHFGMLEINADTVKPAALLSTSDNSDVKRESTVKSFEIEQNKTNF